MTHLFWLSDDAWAAIEPHLPQGKPGKPRVDDRRVISGILSSSTKRGLGTLSHQASISSTPPRSSRRQRVARVRRAGCKLGSLS
jgi:transposase